MGIASECGGSGQLHARAWLVLWLVVGACADHGAPDAGIAREDAARGRDAAPSDAGRDAGRDAAEAPPPCSDGLWSHMGYDLRNNYFNPDETTLSPDNAVEIVEKWRFDTTGMPPGTPIIAEGKVFVLATGAAYAIDLVTGKAVWMRSDIRGTSSMAYDCGFVYAHAGDATLYKLDAGTGDTVWGPVATNSIKGCTGTSSPVVAGDKVIVGRECGPLEISFNVAGVRGGVAAFFAGDGSPAWEYATTTGDEDGAAVWSTVSVDLDTGTVYATTGNNYTVLGPGSDAFHALDLATGERLWVSQVRDYDVWSLFGAPTGPDTDIGANPILVDLGDERLVAAGDKGSKFSVLDRRTGAMKWRRDMLSPTRDAAHGGKLMNGAFDGERLYAIFNDALGNASLLRAFDAMTGEDAWPPKRYPVYVWGAPSLANGLLIAPINDEVHLLDARTGEELKTFVAGGTIAGGAPAVAAGRIVVGGGLQYSLGGTSVKPGNQVVCYGLPW